MKLIDCILAAFAGDIIGSAIVTPECLASDFVTGH
jgi:hypothetical protein